MTCVIWLHRPNGKACAEGGGEALKPRPTPASPSAFQKGQASPHTRPSLGTSGNEFRAILPSSAGATRAGNGADTFEECGPSRVGRDERRPAALRSHRR